MSTSQPWHTSSHTQPAEQQASDPIVGVLLVHGLNGNRGDMEELTDFLATHGMVTENILLPGHGSHVRDMLGLGWQDWAEAVQQELALLKQRCDMVFLIGHSLGGALCLHTAAHEEVAGVVPMCAPLHMHPWLGLAIRFARRFTPMVPTIRQDLRDPVARRGYAWGVYGWTPMEPVESMIQFLPTLRTELPRITVPTLIITALHDHVVPARDGREIYRLLGSQEKHLVTLHRSYHVVMKDYDREEVFEKTLAFIQRHARTEKAQRTQMPKQTDQSA